MLIKLVVLLCLYATVVVCHRPARARGVFREEQRPAGADLKRSHGYGHSTFVQAGLAGPRPSAPRPRQLDPRLRNGLALAESLTSSRAALPPRLSRARGFTRAELRPRPHGLVAAKPRPPRCIRSCGRAGTLRGGAAVSSLSSMTALLPCPGGDHGLVPGHPDALPRQSSFGLDGRDGLTL